MITFFKSQEDPKLKIQINIMKIPNLVVFIIFPFIKNYLRKNLPPEESKQKWGKFGSRGVQLGSICGRKFGKA